MLHFRILCSCLPLTLTLACGARADIVTVTVAASLVTTAKAVGEAFQRDTGHEIVPGPGTTGKLYAQIVNRAPFDVFLVANVARPEALEADGLPVVCMSHSL